MSTVRADFADELASVRGEPVTTAGVGDSIDRGLRALQRLPWLIVLAVALLLAVHEWSATRLPQAAELTLAVGELQVLLSTRDRPPAGPAAERERRAWSVLQTSQAELGADLGPLRELDRLLQRRDALAVTPAPGRAGEIGQARRHVEREMLTQLERLAAAVQAQLQDDARRRRRTEMLIFAGVVAALAVVVVLASSALRRLNAQRAALVLSLERRARWHALLEQIVARMPSQVVVTDLQGRIEWVNPAFERVTGWTLAEARGRRPGELLHGPGTDAAARRRVSAAIRSLQPIEGVELLNYRRDGTPYWIELSIRPLDDASGQPSRLVGIASDVSAHRQAAQVAAEARDTALAADRAKSELLARISHELRTPMNGILGFARLLESHAELTAAEPRRFARVIGRASRQLLALLDDTLDLARLDADALRVECRPTDLGALAEQALDEVAPALREAGQVLHAEGLGARERWVHADPVRVRQVIANLLSNAIKYNRPQGRVRVRLQPLGDGEIALTVGDEGRGIDPALRARLFEPFDRLGAERTAIPGAGLGLAIAQRLVKRMAGRLEVDSSPGRGSRFAIVLPRAPAPAAPAPATDFAPLDTGDGGAVRGRVLYVEDDEVNAMVLQAVLAARPGIEIVVARDGAAAVAAAARQAFDFALIDLNLPDMSGHEVLRALRRLPGGTRLRCIAYSAALRSETGGEPGDGDFDEHWTKPAEPAWLVAACERLLAADGDAQTGDCHVYESHIGV